MTRSAAIETSTEQRQALFRRLYLDAYPGVARQIARRGGTPDDARDIFQESLVIYYENMVAGKLPEHTSPPAYLAGIARHLWLRKMRGGEKVRPFYEEEDFASETEIPYSRHRLLALLERSGRRCLELLRAFYYDNASPEEAAEQFGYSGVRSVTVQKYKCLEKIRDEVKNKSLQHADFTE